MWSALGSGLEGFGPEADALAVSDTSLYAGGIFTKAGGKPTVNVARAAFIAPTLPLLLSSPALAGGTFTAWFTNSPGLTFGGLGAADPSQPLNTWLSVGSVAEVTPGVFRFTDPQAGNSGQRYYRIKWPE